MKTLTDLKKDAKSGGYEARMVVRCGDKNIPDRLSGWRRIVAANTKSIFFEATDGRISELPLTKATLTEYDGERLAIYDAGFRELDEEERLVMDKWSEYANNPQFKERQEADVLTDGSSTYWSEVAFFSKAGKEYLLGNKWQRGLKYDWNRKQVQDERIKGSLSMLYEIRKRGALEGGNER